MPGVARFRDRAEAGRRLAEQLRALAGEDVVVLALPRGGLPVAAEVASALHAPLDVVVVRKLGLPRQPELAMGAVGEDGRVVWNDDVRRLARVSDDEVNAVLARESAEVARRAASIRRSDQRVPIAGRTAVIVDDGIATGSTMTVACRVVRAHGAARVVVAVPVVSAGTVAALLSEADDIVSVVTPQRLSAVGEWYDDFAQLTDDEVTRVLAAQS
jgi:putative phosphoribosyl transferase